MLDQFLQKASAFPKPQNPLVPKKRDMGDLREFLAELDRAFGKRPTWAQERLTVKNGLLALLRDPANPLAGYPTLGSPKKGQSVAEFHDEVYNRLRIPDWDKELSKARVSVTSNNLSRYAGLHQGLVRQKEETRARNEQRRLAEAVASLPFTLEDFGANRHLNSVPTKDGGSIPLSRALSMLQEKGVPQPPGLTTEQIEAAQEAQAANRLITERQFVQGQTEEEATKEAAKVDLPKGEFQKIQESKPGQGGSLNLDPVTGTIIEIVGSPIVAAKTLFDPDATAEQKSNAALELIAEAIGLGAAKGAFKGVRSLVRFAESDEFAESLARLEIPDHIKVVEEARSYLDDPKFYTYLESAAKKLETAQGKGGFDEAAEFSARQVGTPPDPPTVGSKEAIDRFKKALEESERVGRPERERAVTELRETQSGRLSSMTARGKAAVMAGRAARKVGEAEVPDFILKEPVSKADQDALINVVLDHPWGDKVQSRQDAVEALAGIFDKGKLPHEYEVNLLREVFGDDLVRALTGKGQTVGARLDRFGREMQLMNPYARVFDAVSNAAKFAAYVAQNPARSLISSLTFGKTVGRETLITPTKAWNVMRGYRKTLSNDVNEVIAGINKATGEKFEGRTGLFTKAAAMTDAPFYPLYERLALDDYAVTAAKNLPGGTKANRQAIFKQLTEGGTGPLSKTQVAEAKALANDWALRQTYNIDNFASKSISRVRESAAKSIEKNLPGRPGQELADLWRLGVNVNTRFSRVIGNVALDAANHIPAAGIGEAAVRALLGRWAGKVPTADVRLISDLASKGLTGMATTAIGTALWPQFKDSELLKGEVVTTKGGTKFVRWTLAPEVHGGMDADQLPGPFKAMLRGMTAAMLDDMESSGELTESQREDVWLKYQLDQAVSQPAVTGSLNLLKVALGDASLEQWAGSKVSSQLLPGGLREYTERRDEEQNDVLLRKAGEEDSKFWAEFKKRIPGLRETLDPNVKNDVTAMSRDKRRQEFKAQRQDFKAKRQSVGVTWRKRT